MSSEFVKTVTVTLEEYEELRDFHREYESLERFGPEDLQIMRNNIKTHDLIAKLNGTTKRWFELTPVRHEPEVQELYTSLQGIFRTYNPDDWSDNE